MMEMHDLEIAASGRNCLPGAESFYFQDVHREIGWGDGDKAVVQIKLANETSGQPLWQFTKLADGCDKIGDTKSGDVLTVAKTADGSVRIVTAPWSEAGGQKWLLEKIDPATLTM